MRKLTIIIVLISLCSFNNVHAQVSSLLMLDGKTIQISDYKLDTSDYYEGKIEFVTSKGSSKDKYIDEVFSITDASGNETVIYKPSLELGEVLTVDQMRLYINGLNQAKNATISPMVFYGGLMAGFGSVMLPKPELQFGDNSMNVPLGIMVPVTYIGLVGANTPKAEVLQQQLPNTPSNEHYLMGYQEGVRKKRFKNSIIGAAIGVVGGIVFVSLAN